MTGSPALHGASWRQAREAAAAAATALAAQSVTFEDALGLALARPLTARHPMPPFDTATMDGWAVAGTPPWRVVGRQLAGDASSELAMGEAVEIATGAQVPRGAHAVLRREHGALHDDRLTRPDGPLAAGRDVRPAGEDAQAGDTLLDAGRRVTPAVLGLAAAAGYDELTVHGRPRVDLLVLGDELLTSGPPRAGAVRDALGPQLSGWFPLGTAHVRPPRRVADSLDATAEALAATTGDLVVTTGGTARGPVDQVHRALAAVGGRLVVDSVLVRPGHPMLLATLPGDRFLVGLPGNPLAAAVAFATLAVPVLQQLRGQTTPATRTLALARRHEPGRHHLVLPAALDAAGRAEPLPFRGSASLRGLAVADLLVVIPPEGVAAGGLVEMLPLPWRDG